MNNKENIENMIENGRKTVKMTAVRVGAAATLLLTAAGCDRSLNVSFNENPTSTPTPSIAEQIAVGLATALAEKENANPINQPIATATTIATIGSDKYIITPIVREPAPEPTIKKVDPTSTPVSKESLTAAPRSGDGWILQHPDGDKTEVRTLPAGFTPDKDLHFATDIKPLAIGSDLKIYSDWETALNTKRAGGALAGYNYDYNDFCNNVNPAFTCTRQNDMYSWLVFQGEEVSVPGIGTLKGGPRRSVVLEILNLDGSVYAWDSANPVYVKHGFTANGRIFDGSKNVDVLERNLSGHWLSRQFAGTPEKSYIGITDSPGNALEVLLVSAQRKQWGSNEDSSKRMEFQLVRAEIVSAAK